MGVRTWGQVAGCVSVVVVCAENGACEKSAVLWVVLLGGCAMVGWEWCGNVLCFGGFWWIVVGVGAPPLSKCRVA
jgi:hypothetical protein